MQIQKSKTSVVVVLLCATAAAVATAGSAEGAPRSFSAKSLALQEVEVRTLSAVDNRLLIQKADEEESRLFGRPLIYAEPIATGLSTQDSGNWETLADGSRLWRLRVRSPGALSLNLHFGRFELPPGAELWIYNAAGDHIQGPYIADDRNLHGELWTALVYGDEVVLELSVPAAAEAPLLELTAVNHGFRSFREKQGGCNNDVVCPEGDLFRDQIDAVVRLSIAGVRACTGQLINNTADDDRPLVLTAFHCILDDFEEPDFSLVPSTVAYFNFESPTCGALSGGQLSQSVSGATFLAGHQPTDFLLTELNETPPSDFGAYLTGWNASGETPGGAVGIHHPSADEKAISFDEDPLTTDVEFFNETHWRIGDWEDGTTEPGSSGSCIFDPADGLCVGTLTGGFATCFAGPTARTEDYYGKLSAAWNGGGTRESRLRDWLDPLGLGVDRWEGKGLGTGTGTQGGGACVANETTLCLRDGRFVAEIDFRDFQNQTGAARVSSLRTVDSGLFYFFDENNLEVLVKVLDGCSITNHFWVFAAATTDVEYTLTVRDTETNVSQTYTNPLGNAAAAVTDTSALAVCP